METKIENILEDIKNICREHNQTFAQVISEAFYLFDDDFEESTDSQVETAIQNYGKLLKVKANEL